jgi:hypothetical protein
VTIESGEASERAIALVADLNRFVTAHTDSLPSEDARDIRLVAALVLLSRLVVTEVICPAPGASLPSMAHIATVIRRSPLESAAELAIKMLEDERGPATAAQAP